jgi:hypothetical protein
MTTSHRKEQAERLALAGSTTGMTYHSRAITGLDLERSGRHAQHATVTGSKPAVAYPRQPSGSPWAGEVPESIEPPLGNAIDSQECTGEVFEVAASVAIPSSDAVPAREDVDATPPRSAAPVEDLVSSSTGVTPNVIAEPGLRRGRKL